MTAVATLAKSFGWVGRFAVALANQAIIAAIVVVVTMWLSERVVRTIGWYRKDETNGAWFRLPAATQYVASITTGLLVGAVVAWLASDPQARRLWSLCPIAAGLVTGWVRATSRIEDGARIQGLLDRSRPTARHASGG
jgi:hypothetical protein